MTGNKIRIRENYGSGGYDPFDGKHNNSTPVRYYYYDDQMKELFRWVEKEQDLWKVQTNYTGG